MLLNTWWLGLFQLLFIKGCLSVYIEAMPKDILVLPNQNVTFLCRVAVPIQYCRMEVPGMASLNLSPTTPSFKGVTYFGIGLQSGQCGVAIENVNELNNGDIKCTLGIPTESQESTSLMRLTVARAPKRPQLEILRGSDNYWAHKLGDVLRATCVVRDARPVANISWFLDDEPIPHSLLSQPTIVNGNEGDLQTIYQNITKELKPSDNGRELKCIASHPALPDNTIAYVQLNVTYPPQPQSNPIDKFGYVLGKDGVIALDITANPRPHLEWKIRDQYIKEGGHDSTGRIKAEEIQELGRGRYQAALVIANINKQDTESQYILKAYNDMGTQDYFILISTSAEPEDLELGVLSIIGIVIAVLVLLLIVFLVIFARVTGRWCFSGAAVVRQTGESSDTESVDVRSKSNRSLIPPLKFTSLFKRNKDKEDEERPRSADTMETKIPIEDSEKQTTPESKEGIVYAELDLVNPHSKPIVKSDDDKTEYAEIVYTQKEGEETKKGNDDKKSNVSS